VYGYGRSFAMVGTLENSRSGWTELVGAVGRTFEINGWPAHSAAAGIAHAEDGWYGQVYYVPTVPVGHAWLRATAELDVPVTSRGTTQFALSPVSLTIPALRVLEIGLSVDVGAARGARTGIALGPELRVLLPKAVLGTNLQRMTDGSASRMRLFFTTSFP
jgi:hypothetical protein